jgi:hypothetical protein
LTSFHLFSLVELEHVAMFGAYVIRERIRYAVLKIPRTPDRIRVSILSIHSRTNFVLGESHMNGRRRLVDRNSNPL